jgi:hypothetical protein
MRVAGIQVLCWVAALLLIGGASAAPLKRFSGTIDYEGPGVNPTGYNQFHSFVARSSLGVTFLDEYGTNTRYRFCWRKHGGQEARCWKRQTGLTETRSIIHAAAPRRPGSYLGTWYVGGHPVAEWRFRVVAAKH